MTRPQTIDGDFLTELEHETIELLGQVATNMRRIITQASPANDISARGDTNEMVGWIHVLQHMVLSQAAARIYPELYRPLGGGILGL